MTPSSLIRYAILASLALPLPLWAADDAPTGAPVATSRVAQLEARLNEVEAKAQAAEAKVAQLQEAQEQNWLTDERTEQIKSIVKDVIADAKSRGQFLDGDLQAGYDNGFFIRTADKNYSLKINGIIQARYTYDYHTFPNGRLNTLASSKGDDPYNASGFEIPRARIAFSGNVAAPEVLYRIEASFDNGGSAAINDAWVGYKLSDLLLPKGGSFLAPFAKEDPMNWARTGLINKPEEFVPFDPQWVVGVDAYGEFLKDQFSYEVSVNDGSKTYRAGSVDNAGASAGLNNRPAFDGRLQYAGNGKLSDFVDESDFRKDTSSFVWELAGGAAYESHISTTNAYPAPQTLSITGVANPSGGFTSYNLNGDLYRATVDASAKWQGFSFVSAFYYQSLDVLPTTTNRNSEFGDYGYYGQLGYMILPRKLEVVGRAGEILTDGFAQQSQYYTVGLNYFIYGYNAKLSTDLTYIPGHDALNNAAYGDLQNAQSIIAKVQFSVLF